MPSQNARQHGSRSTIRHPPTKTSDCATEDDPATVRIGDDGGITLIWSVSWAYSADESSTREPRLDEFTEAQIAELRSMSEANGREEVRRAARAVLRWAEGYTRGEAVAPTSYGIGWLRALREDIAEHGVVALKEREYRASRSGRSDEA